MSLKFTATYTKDGKWYVAHCAELDVASQGETIEEAETNLAEAIDLYLEDVPIEELSCFMETPFVRTIEFNKA